MNDKQYQELKNFDCRIEKTIATLTNTVNGIKNSLNNLHYQKSLIIKNNGVGITPLNFDTLDFLGGNAFSEGHTVKVTFPNGSGGSVLDYSITNVKLAKSPPLTLKGNKFVTNSEVQDLTVVEIKNLLSYNKSDIGLSNVDNTKDLDKPLSTADLAALAVKAPLNSPTFTGVPLSVTPSSGDNSTKIATTAFVNTAISNAIIDSTPDATSSVKGKLKLAGDLGGTADLPTVPGLSGKQDTLVNQTNIKSINNTSLLGSGNLAVQAVLVSGTNIKTINGTSLLGSGDITISGGSGSTNLSLDNITSTTLDILSDTGTPVTLPQATTLLAGLLNAADKTKLGGASLTRTNDTNVTISLGGTPNTALLEAVSITVGWTGTLADARITSAANWNLVYQSTNIRVVTSNPTISATTDGTIVMTSTSTVAALPSSVNRVKLTILNLKTSGNISVTGDINGSSGGSLTLAIGESVTVHGDGTSWYIIA